MDSLEERVGALEKKLTRLEDTIAIYQLIASYGPAVDRGDADATAALWLADSTYDWGGTLVCGGEGVAAMVESERHRGIIGTGAAHVASLPHITFDGESATAIGYSRLYRRDGDHFQLFRLSANRWELVKTREGWRVRSRANRLLDGAPEARALLEPAPAAR